MVLEPEVEPVFHDDSYESSGAIDWSLPAAARSSSPREAADPPGAGWFVGLGQLQTRALSVFICTLFVIVKVLDATAGPQVTG